MARIWHLPGIVSKVPIPLKLPIFGIGLVVIHIGPWCWAKEFWPFNRWMDGWIFHLRSKLFPTFQIDFWFVSFEGFIFVPDVKQHYLAETKNMSGALVTLLNHHKVSPLQVEDHHPPEDVTVTSLPVPEELLELKDAVLVALCGLHTPDIAFGGELEADLIADDTWSQHLLTGTKDLDMWLWAWTCFFPHNGWV